jgi:hypothetical protein
VGIIETRGNGLLIAHSLNRPGEKGEVTLRCLNPTNEVIQVRGGTVVGTYVAVEEDDVQVIQDSRREVSVKEELPPHLRELFDGAVKNCADRKAKNGLRDLLLRYQDVFSQGEQDTGRTNLIEHQIPLKPGTRPVRQPPHRLGPEKEAEVERQVEDLQKRGLIEPADGAWSSPVVLVKKKDNTWRFCVDYRRLNDVTQHDAYPLPRIDDSLSTLSGSRYFSTLDLVSGYWQVPMSIEAQEKSAFVTRSGFWKWRVLPFGLTSAPATFQRLMERVLRGLHWKTLLLYLDDIVVIAPDFETHLARLEEVFGRLRGAGLKLKPSKCQLLQTRVGTSATS